MEFSLTTLGVTTQYASLPCLFSQSKKRWLVMMMEGSSSSSSSPSSSFSSSFPCDLPLHQLFQKSSKSSKQEEEEDDDATATTSLSSTTLSEDDDDDVDTSSSSSFNKMVTFAQPLVTNVWTRPRTTIDEMYDLYYTEYDYMDFKIQYLTGHERNKQVSFPPCQVVTSTHVYSTTTTHPSSSSSSSSLQQDLYYSKEELQQFLDDFVQSLHPSQQQQQP